jgi:hypothetical protein
VRKYVSTILPWTGGLRFLFVVISGKGQSMKRSFC